MSKREQFEHLLKWKKEQRELGIWKSESIYVDIETGEIILK